jgi:hypothetical protein
VSTGVIGYAPRESYERGNPETRYGETSVTLFGLRGEQSTLTVVQKSAEGRSRYEAGEASEALQSRKVEKQRGRAATSFTEGPNG